MQTHSCADARHYSRDNYTPRRSRKTPGSKWSGREPFRTVVFVVLAMSCAVLLICLVLNLPAVSNVITSTSLLEVESEWPSTPTSEWTQGVMPALYQKDPKWSNHPYAEGTFGDTGCGPLCMAMLYIYLTGDTSCSPTAIADFADAHSYSGPSGTEWSFMIDGAEYLGIRAEEISLDEHQIQEYLANGYPIVCAMGAGDFTTEGHFIVLAGTDNEGNFIIRDPNSVERTEQTWSFDTLSSQCRNLWVYSY